MIVDVDRLLRALGIVAKKKGHEWEALCPYHEDRKPSWSIRDQPGNDRHGKFNCFSCHAGGDATQLVADFLHVERDEAEQWLQESGITALPDIPFETGVELKGGELSKTCKVPNLVGLGWPLGEWISAPRDYAISRGITPVQVERWGLGYAVSGRIGGRIWIPIRDGAGTLLSWTARSYTGSRLRYLTATREESVRLDAIFGEQHWQGTDQVVLTEGALNALACERAGAENIAALNGSNVTALNVAALSRFRKIVIATDPDKAGQRAAGIVISALKRWKELVVADFPPGRDAADLPTEELSAILGGA